MKKKIVIIDYGLGNTHSVKKSINDLGFETTISSEASTILQADALILPGVGAFGVAMENIRERGLIEVLHQAVQKDKKPILGICLGMQLFATESEEHGHFKGLGWIPGKVKKIPEMPSLHVPHVGWNDIEIIRSQPFFSRLEGNPNFYFDHSYHFVCENRSDVAATVNYGSGIVAAVKKKNIAGVQFHPEKSQINGLRLIKGFLNSIS